MTRDDEALRQLVLRAFVDRGEAPRVAELSARSEGDETSVRAALARLHDAHRVVLDGRGEIRMAHPFSARPMGFVVASREQKWWGGCAWDSVGISAALDAEVLIATTCPGCLRPHVLRTSPTLPPEGNLVAHFLVAGPHWWDDVVHTCSNIRLFCSESRVAEWAGANDQTVGALVDLHTLWRLGHVWYADRLSPAFRPFTPDEAAAVFADLGLHGSFWRLP